mmetsp:Transcript_15071/g.25123  ORF Transcript_15071/g.25123 Transcript_15071/m.25123 type:complete len:586 (-) Transcript_15071:608-2365(-)
MSEILERKRSTSPMPKRGTLVTQGSGKGLERQISKVFGAGGASHSFSDEEKEAFSEHINTCLGEDPILARHLPLDVTSMDLFEKSSDGLILCQLINLAQRDAIDERAVNNKDSINIYQKTENQNLVLNAAKAIGCQVINIGASDLIEGRPILVLGLVWQIIKIQLLSQISLRNVPELVLLLDLDAEETMRDFLKLHPEVILLRWLNYHLAKAGSSRRVNNFGSDLSDSEVYGLVLNQLDPERCAPISMAENPMARAGKAINYAKAIGAEVFLKPKDICDGNKKLNTSMVAQLFNTNHGLKIEVADKRRSSQLLDLSALDIGDAGDSREERVFRMWINSLNIENVYVNDLFNETMDGVVLLKVMNQVEPGIVVQKRVNQDPKSRFKKVENGNYVVELGKIMKFSLINVGGLDIVDGNKKLILAIMWQLMRKYTLSVLSELAIKQNISDVSEDHIVAWANETVKASGKSSTMKSFKDSSLKNSIFFLELVAAMEPRAIKWEVVKRTSEESDLLLNAKYVISVARKVGACVFLTPEDIVEVKSKMIMTFLAEVWTAYLQKQDADSAKEAAAAIASTPKSPSIKEDEEG